jgi:malate dehydrogenase
MKIAIIGAAGSVGAPTAFYLGAEKLADEIVMIGGKRQNVLQQHSMDLSTALSSRGVVVRAGTFEDMAGSDIVVNAAGAAQTGVLASRMEMLPKNISLVKEIALQIKQYCPEAIIITATNPVGPLNYTTYLSGGFDRSKLIGYSINDSYRFREMLAREYQVKVSEAEGTVIGEHGATQVLLFSSARIKGEKITVSEDVKQSIRAEVPNILKRYEELQAGRTAGWTCAIGIAGFVRAIAKDSGEILPCSLVLDGEYDTDGLSMSVPAIIGKHGVREILQWDLAPDEQEGLAISKETLKSAVEIVKNNL